MLKLRARPLKPVVLVTESPGGQRCEFDVVLGVGRCQDDGAGLCLFEHDALESSEARRVQVFDHFGDDRRIVPAQTRVAIHQGPMNQLDALPLFWR